jgi:signal transduction histidine kinase
VLKRLSLHARLLLIAGITGLAALLFAWFAIGNVLESVVRRNLNEKLEAQITILERAIGPDGRLDAAKVTPLPGFDGQMPGWGWQVEGPAGKWTGGEPIQNVQMRRGRQARGDQARRGKAIGRSGARLFVRNRDVIRTSGVVRISAAGPRRISERPLREAMAPLLTSLFLLGLGLGLATWAQLRVGLKPLRGLRDAVSRIRSGDAQHIPEGQPKELRPLADEVNALIDQNIAGLSHARAHVANLAHGLKTPLATLALRLEREKASAESRALVAQLDARIAHHLRRARSAAAGAGERARTTLGLVVGDLLAAMGHVHAERNLSLAQSLDSTLMLAVDREDLDEMLGNLLDNACRHARKTVRVSASAEGPNLNVMIEDDGPGIVQDQMAAALNPGTRLDETSKGYGFGLGIAQELAELYGGSLRLERSSKLGGLMATLVLPRQK